MYRCAHCPAQADDWAYDHEDPDELALPTGRLPHSLDLARYIPLCRSCHVRFDNAHRRVGRPSRPPLARITVNLPPSPDVLARLDRFAEQNRWTRSTAAAVLIERGLPGETGPAAEDPTARQQPAGPGRPAHRANCKCAVCKPR